MASLACAHLLILGANQLLSDLGLRAAVRLLTDKTRSSPIRTPLNKLVQVGRARAGWQTTLLPCRRVEITQNLQGRACRAAPTRIKELRNFGPDTQLSPALAIAHLAVKIMARDKFHRVMAISSP